MSASNTTFTSEGFDLDAIPAADGNARNGHSGLQAQDVVYEIGGGVSPLPTLSTQEKEHSLNNDNSSLILEAESLKAEGNEQFKIGAYLEAYDMYTKAIDVCPVEMKGDKLLQLRDDFEQKQHEKAIESHRLKQKQHEPSYSDITEKQQSQKEKEENCKRDEPALEEFIAPNQLYGDKLAIYYCNRAACLMHLERYDEAIADCDVAVLLNPKYTKAFVRRSATYEKTENTEAALRDAKIALGFDPTNTNIRKSVSRLQKIEDERLEKIKDETIGKLKDLGNSILGNFGLSLDNFKTVQDPTTGSYSVTFEQQPPTNK